MAITLNDLTVNFSHLDRETLLDDWQWLIGPSKKPILLTTSGNAFVQDAEDGSVHLLDTGNGGIYPVADDEEHFRPRLANTEFVTNYLAVRMVAGLQKIGRTLQPGQIYSFKVPPILGGAYALGNIEATDISVHFSLSGQMCEQARNLPPGTKISGFSIG